MAISGIGFGDVRSSSPVIRASAPGIEATPVRSFGAFATRGFEVLAGPLVALFLVLPAPALADGSVAGNYRGAGCPKSAESCIPTTGRDHLEVKERAGGFDVSLVIFFDAGNRCALSGTGAFDGEAMAITARVPDSSLSCTLRLQPQKTYLELHDPEMKCREFFCGTRGILEGTRFVKKK